MNDLGTSKGTLLLISFCLLPCLAYMAKNAKAVCFGANIISRLCSASSEEVWKRGDIILISFNRDLLSRTSVSFSQTLDAKK